MKKTIYLFLSLLLIYYTISIPVFSEGNNSSSNFSGDIEIDSDSSESEEYIPHAKYMQITDLDSGTVIYKQHSDKKFNPGSAVKILTAITAIENTDDPEKIITVPDKILSDYDYKNGNIGLITGEKISIKNLIYAMMMQDAGDCALVLANTVGKSYKDFILKMNKIAIKAGAKNSKFTDATGFDKKNQVTTVEDLGKITEYAIKNSMFNDYVSCKRVEINPTNKYSLPRIFFSTNKFLSRYYSEDYYSESIRGVKGYYNSDDDCGLVIRYTSKGNDLLCICAKSDCNDNVNNSYNDINYLIEKGTTFYTNVCLIKKGDVITEVKLTNGKNATRVLLCSSTDLYSKLPKDYDRDKINKQVSINDNIKAPIKKGEVFGSVKFIYNGIEYGNVSLIADSDIESSFFKHFSLILKSIFTSHIFILLIILITIAFLLVTIYINFKKMLKGKK